MSTHNIYFHGEIFIFSYFFMKTYVVGTHKKQITEAFLMSTHNMFSWRNKKKYYMATPPPISGDIMLPCYHNTIYTLSILTHYLLTVYIPYSYLLMCRNMAE